MMSRYRRELATMMSRVEQSGARIVETTRGPIEYLEFGDGPPVLLIHGVVEGADHGPYLAKNYLGDGFRVIAISRFGYVGSPMAADSSPAAQADLCATLLDNLGIDDVAVVATSAGTAPAFRFGMQYPDRCRALAIWSQAVPPYTVPPRLVTSLLRAFFGSNFAFWFLLNTTPPIRMRLIGVPRRLQHGERSPDEQRIIEELVMSFLPLSRRVDGILNDIKVTNPDLNNMSLERLKVPTLIIHAKDDPWGTHDGAKRMASSAPQAEFVEFEDGGHLLLGHIEEARSLIGSFVHQHDPNGPQRSARERPITSL